MISKLYRFKSGILFVLYTICFIFLLYRLFLIQYVRYAYLRPKAKDMHEIQLKLAPMRGDITDRHGNLLGTSVPVPSLYCDPSQIKDAKLTAQEVASVLDLKKDFVYERITREKRFVWIKRKITHEQKKAIKSLKLKGIHFLDEPKRFYPKGSLGTHIVGFVDVDNNGLEGIESVCNRYLAGRPGKRITEKDAAGREVLSWRYKEISPVEGYKVILTIDEVIQDMVEEELDKAWDIYNPKGASVIVLDPYTGEILALSNRPTYDPNKYSKTNADTRRNRALTDTFEPGSVMKIFVAGAALNEGLLGLMDSIYCENGVFKTPGGYLRDHNGHGDLTFQEVIEKSSNIGMAKVGIMLGKQRLYEYLRDFGFGQCTDVLMYGEVAGVLRPPSRWSKMSITRIPMGHEISTTVIQLAVAASTVANGGTLMKPLIVKRIEDNKGRLIKEFKPEIVAEKILSEEAIRKLKVALVGVVSPRGTAKKAKIDGYRVAGKTGTAQKINPDGTYSHKNFISSFVGFVPVNKPRLVVFVVFDSPRPVYYGGSVAAPVFSSIAKKALSYLNVEPEIKETLVAK